MWENYELNNLIKNKSKIHYFGFGKGPYKNTFVQKYLNRCKYNECVQNGEAYLMTLAKTLKTAKCISKIYPKPLGIILEYNLHVLLNVIANLFIYEHG